MVDEAPCDEKYLKLIKSNLISDENRPNHPKNQRILLQIHNRKSAGFKTQLHGGAFKDTPKYETCKPAVEKHQSEDRERDNEREETL